MYVYVLSAPFVKEIMLTLLNGPIPSAENQLYVYAD